MGDAKRETAPLDELVIAGPTTDADAAILTPDALAFLADLAARFADEFPSALQRRADRRKEWEAGATPAFLTETADVRAGDWRVAPMPSDLTKRTIEITGPVSRKMVINALNSGADVFMADFEDSTAPSWRNILDGQRNLRDAIRHQVDFKDPVSGKEYKLCDSPATLLVRPRGLHLPERHLNWRGGDLPASLCDFGLYFFHNARELVARGSGPYFYLPKLESHREARLWNEIFLQAQEALGLPRGTIRATVLIETLPAAFEMDEILHELREHSSGLNCGRWDYIFSFIKTRRWDAQALLPDRSEVTMEQPFMRAYTQLAIRTCHRRGAHAIGGMAAQIPIKNDPAANEAALSKVRADKLREVNDGHDGTWVAHPGLVALAREAFDSVMTGDHQLHRLRDDVESGEADLLEVPVGARTEAGLRLNVRVGVLYLEAWISGNGCVPLYNLMEDAATAEISRAQVWQWLRHAAKLDDGRVVDRPLVEQVLVEETDEIRREVGAERFESGRFGEAARLFSELCFSEEMLEFLTNGAYELLVTPQRAGNE